ncbi:amidase [Lipingzhangella halophila]|uniref:Amidase n=1 Tax=Lipingzhangella halophila TaxID=1783352 RepID=A0A7W7RJP5_9ACTN|nr:amidase [Lipingzhangella halophila]MBB4933244.1 amidase [Lipingzhangella halophila]
MSQIHDLTAIELVERVRRRELSPVQITDHYLERIARHDRALGAFITVTEDFAREQARKAENRVLRDTPGELPPLLGVPVPIKDLDPLAGVRHTSGSTIYADRVAGVDAAFVAALRQAGAVFPGKTNTPEFGSPCYTENDIAPAARTPWDLSRSAGGSSGGAAAAVAGGLSPVAQGSDGGGSIRIPASACGTYGLKPTRGRISGAPLTPDLLGLATAGPLTRTVSDAALLLDAMSVNRPGDYYTAPPLGTGETFLEHARREPGTLRIARFRTPVMAADEVHPEVLAAYESATELLAKLGHDIEEIAPPFDASVAEDFRTVWAAMAIAVPLPSGSEPHLRPINRWLREQAMGTTLDRYMRATIRLQQRVRAALPAMLDYDAVLTPTLAQPPVPVGHFAAAPEEELRRMERFTPYTAIFNITGQPSASVPLYWSDEGLPIGVMLSGRIGGEPTLLSLSAQLEAVHPWAHRRPPVWAE